MNTPLFALPSDAYAVTSDDCYTPRWVFDAMGLRFDLDVAAPRGGPWHVPAERWYTAEDDGLAQPWDGLVWCNPPYSQMTDWVEAWASHDRGCLMGMVWPNKWFAAVIEAAEAMTFSAVEFIRPDGKALKLRQQVFVAFRGVGTERPLNVSPPLIPTAPSSTEGQQHDHPTPTPAADVHHRRRLDRAPTCEGGHRMIEDRCPHGRHAYGAKEGES